MLARAAESPVTLWNIAHFLYSRRLTLKNIFGKSFKGDCIGNFFFQVAKWSKALYNKSQPVGNCRLMCMGSNLQWRQIPCTLILIFLQKPQYMCACSSNWIFRSSFFSAILAPMPPSDHADWSSHVTPHGFRSHVKPEEYPKLHWKVTDYSQE